MWAAAAVVVVVVAAAEAGMEAKGMSAEMADCRCCCGCGGGGGGSGGGARAYLSSSQLLRRVPPNGFAATVMQRPVPSWVAGGLHDSGRRRRGGEKQNRHAAVRRPAPGLRWLLHGLWVGVRGWYEQNTAMQQQ